MSSSEFDFCIMPQLIRLPSPERVEELLRHMRPVVKSPDSGWYREVDISQVDAFKEHYLWDPILIGPELAAINTASAEIPTFHTYSASAIFRPTLAEVLSAIEQTCGENWRQVRYFYLDQGRLDRIGGRGVIGRYHFARCVLFNRMLVRDPSQILGRGLKEFEFPADWPKPREVPSGAAEV